MPTEAPAVPHAPSTDEFFDRHWRATVSALTPEMADYLTAEDAAFRGLLTRHLYRFVVEVGCADGRLLLPAVLDAGIGYLGVDRASGAVHATRQALPSPEAGTVVQGHARSLPELADLIPARGTATVYPFNVLGNISNPREALRAAAECHTDIVIFTYRMNKSSRAARMAYYQGLVADARLEDAADGVHLRSAAGFRSAVYRPEVLRDWLTSLGYRVEVSTFSPIGLLVHGTLG